MTDENIMDFGRVIDRFDAGRVDVKFVYKDGGAIGVRYDSVIKILEANQAMIALVEKLSGQPLDLRRLSSYELKRIREIQE